MYGEFHLFKLHGKKWFSKWDPMFKERKVHSFYVIYVNYDCQASKLSRNLFEMKLKFGHTWRGSSPDTASVSSQNSPHGSLKNGMGKENCRTFSFDCYV